MSQLIYTLAPLNEAEPVLPDWITAIGEHAFGGILQGNHYLRSVVLPDGLRKLDKHAFWLCGG